MHDHIHPGTTQPLVSPLIIDFFHDAVCGWCYVMSPRLRQVAADLGIQVRHHTFVLQDSREQMLRAFGSMERAKREILGHWAACAQHDDTQSINIEGMRAQNFEYPHGMLSALACQAACLLAGEQGYWDYFDAVQRAHLAESRNIGDMDTLLAIAVAQGFDGEAFLSAMDSDIAHQRVQADRTQAARLGIQSIPTVLVSSRETGQELARLQTQPADMLKSRLLALL
ncbi:DsbA family oxidoreductase [Alcaligenes faecalis]|uniref:DsbA family oxidoreductase n=1 Tax=Alcaligenes faecalis TaxID=511 RepID=UPI001C9B715C|nr:DsbA family protein [Alcaligenes faecalis]MBY6311137.1 DsbA family protein [Alcaligenes faecalis]MBY6316182.1 DsbA family protein [Alcaligenes faecalis]MBY6390611.1 DsbA family protein [Alcaligenes faecalis]